MAFGTPVAAAVAYSTAGGTSVSPAYPTGILATDVVLLFTGQKPLNANANGGTATTPSGWTLRDELLAAGGYGTTIGIDLGNTNLRVYSWNTPVAGQTGNLAITLGQNEMSWAFMVRIPTGTGSVAFGSADGQRTTAPTSPMTIALTNGATATNFQAGDLAIWAMCIPTDVTTPAQFSAHSVTATGATFNTAVELNEPDSSVGNDIGGFSAYATVASGSSTAAPSITVTLAGTLTNVRGPLVMLRLRESLAIRTGSGAATEAGSDTASGTGDVHVKGSCAATETGSDTAAATGTVGNAAITGSGAAAETGSDTAAATGDVIVKGSGAATEAGSDTAAGAGDVIVRGSGAAAEVGADTAAVTGDVFVRGSSALLEVGTDAAAATGKVLVKGSGATQEVGSDTAAAAGGNVVTGYGALIETGADAAAATGDVIIQGAIALVEVGSDTAAAAGKVLVRGTGAATELANDTALGSGGAVSTGSGDALESGADAVASEGLVRVQGTGALLEVGADNATGSGKVIVNGIGVLQETGADTASGTSAPLSPVTGSGAATESGSDILIGYVRPGYVDDGYVLGVFGFLGPYIAPAGGIGTRPPIRPQDYQPMFTDRPRKKRQQDIVFLGH